MPRKRLVGWATLAVLFIAWEAGWWISTGKWETMIVLPAIVLGLGALLGLVALLSWAFDWPEGE